MPDFLFPGATDYHDPSYPADRLVMLGVKSTCKDRWRQVLAEADRIETKHLLTLEPRLSKAQVSEMASRRVTPVLPAPLIESIASEQQGLVLDVRSFISEVRQRLG